jgi:hypothetical protein
MQSETLINPVSNKMLWAGRIVSALPVLMLLMSAIMKFVQPTGMGEGMAQLGWDISQAFGLGVLELACILIYVIRQTSVLGAILLTGYLGGAVATHVRVGDPWIIPVVLGVRLWLGLYLREPRLRSLLPFRSKN